MKPSVLFVDDEHLILTSLRRLFRHDDIGFVEVDSGEQALELLTREEVAVIVTDNRMPGMGGLELLAKVRALHPDTVRIMMTGHADLPTAIAAINRGEVFRFVTKPWDDDEFRATVREGIDRYQVVRSLKDADEASMKSLAQAIELKDPYTRGHCDRVAAFSLEIADRLGLPDDLKLHIKHGSWLHDCGKIGVPETVLNKNGPLTDTEFATIQNHPTWGAEVARQAVLPAPVLHVILHHHEKYGGGGYPMGIAGDRIPLEARIVAVADVYDAITSDRPYRDGMSHAKAAEILRDMAGPHLDPELVTLFLELRGDAPATNCPPGSGCGPNSTAADSIFGTDAP